MSTAFQGQQRKFEERLKLKLDLLDKKSPATVEDLLFSLSLGPRFSSVSGHRLHTTAHHSNEEQMAIKKALAKVPRTHVETVATMEEMHQSSVPFLQRLFRGVFTCELCQFFFSRFSF